MGGFEKKILIMLFYACKTGWVEVENILMIIKTNWKYHTIKTNIETNRNICDFGHAMGVYTLDCNIDLWPLKVVLTERQDFSSNFDTFQLPFANN